jgi:hypothetical protein
MKEYGFGQPPPTPKDEHNDIVDCSCHTKSKFFSLLSSSPLLSPQEEGMFA